LVIVVLRKRVGEGKEEGMGVILMIENEDDA
jgi:hypothetical protein